MQWYKTLSFNVYSLSFFINDETLIFFSYLCNHKWFDTELNKAIYEQVSLNRGLPELIGIVLSEEFADIVMRFLQTTFEVNRRPTHCIATSSVLVIPIL